MRIKMSQGDFLRAYELGQEALKNWGPHLLLRTDLASCQYMLGDFRSYQKNTLEIYSDLQLFGDRVNSEYFIRCSLGLGKLLEELGAIYLAKKIYSKCLNLEVGSQANHMVMAQYLRLLSMFSVTEESATLYLTCEQLKAQTNALSVDVQLALLHADIYFLGLADASGRIETLLSDSDTPKFNRRLLIFDFLFECLRSQKIECFPEKYLSEFDYLECDSFEKGIWDVYHSVIQTKTMDPSMLAQTSEMSPMCALRYLLVIWRNSSSSATVALALKKLLLLLQTIEPKSRTLLTQVWGLSRNSEVTIELKKSSGQIHIDTNVIDLQGSPMILQLLSLLAEKQKMGVESAIQFIYQAGFDENSFHRIRMLIKRTNRKILPVLGGENFVTLKEMDLKLDPRVRIKVVA